MKYKINSPSCIFREAQFRVIPAMIVKTKSSCFKRNSEQFGADTIVQNNVTNHGFGIAKTCLYVQCILFLDLQLPVYARGLCDKGPGRKKNPSASYISRNQ